MAVPAANKSSAVWCVAEQCSAGARDDGLHDLGSAVTDLEAQHIAQALFHRPAVVAAVPKAQQALVDHVVCQLGAPPLGHTCLGGVR